MNLVKLLMQQVFVGVMVSVPWYRGFLDVGLTAYVIDFPLPPTDLNGV